MMRARNEMIGAVVVCDDVRLEVGRKHTLVGVFSGDIIVGKLPFTIRLSIWIEYLPEREGKQDGHFKIRFSDKEPIVLKMEIDIHKMGPIALVIPQFVIRGEFEGDLTVEFSSDGEVWQEISKKRILLGKLEPRDGLIPSLPASLGG